MDQIDLDTGLGTSSLVQELVEAIRLQKYASRKLEHALNLVSLEADTLAQSNVVHAPEFIGPIVPGRAVTTDMLRPSVDFTPYQLLPNAIDQNLARNNWGLVDEPGRGALTTTPPLPLFEEGLNLANPSSSTPYAGPNCEDALWRGHPSGCERLDPLGTSYDFHPQQVTPNPAAFSLTLGDFSLLPNETLFPEAYPNSERTALTPPLSVVKTSPPPSTNSDNGGYTHGLYGVGNDSTANDNFPHTHTEERTSTPAPQMVELSTDMTAGELEGILDGIQSESHSPAASSSGGSYDRVRNSEVRAMRLEEIRRFLGIDWTKDELFTLQSAIRFLRGTVPVVEGGKGHRKRAIRACFETLQRIVGPYTEKLAFNKALSNFLVNFTPQVDAPPQDNGKLYGVFRLDGE